VKPTALFYCQHSLGIGHLTRSFALVRALERRFRVVLLNGGPLPAGVAVPENIDIIHLPPLGVDAQQRLVSRDAGLPLAEAQARRRALILEAFHACRPALVLIELFPFGRKKFAGELLPLLRAAKASVSRPTVACSLRDILVSARDDQQRHDERARRLAQRYFDLVLVHADPAFARLDESFRPARPLRVPVHYTGFVVPAREASRTERQRHVLVSAGGGIVGYPLLAAALEAQRLLWPRHALPFRLVAGPFLPEPDWRALCESARGREGVELVRHVPDLALEMRRAAASVSQCGYNSALDIVVAGVPALVVPYADAGENEQTERAGKLAALGALRHLPPAELNPQRLAAEIVALTSFTPRPAAIDLDGAERSAQLLADAAVSVTPPSRAAA
jgi:predicted glycosyltransferase